MKTKLVSLLAAFALALCLPATAFASSSAFDSGSGESITVQDSYTGNAFLLNRDARNLQVACDFYWAGSTLNASGLSVGAGNGGSALMAGQDISLSSSQIAGSLRAAAQQLQVSNVAVGNNITAAGNSVSISNSSAKGVYAAGSDISVSGNFQAVALTGGSVSLGGNYAGDVQVNAASVRVASGTTVGGTLTVPSDAQVTIEEGASVPSVSYSSVLQQGASSEQGTGGFSIFMCIFACIAHMLLAMFFALLFKESLTRATEMYREKAGRTALSGLVVFIVVPFVALFLLFPLVTIPISAFIFIAMAVVWMFSIPLAGYVLGCRFLPKMRPMGAGVLGTLALTVLAYLPGLITVVPTVCAIFVAGYLWQRWREKRIQAKQAKGDTLPKAE